MSRLCPHCGKSLAVSVAAFTESDRARFWERVTKMEGGCWNFQTKDENTVYGRFSAAGRTLVAHRVAYLMTHGSIPDGKVLIHSCDNPMCCNPAHLSVATQSENMVDMVSKKRREYEGSKNPSSDFTEEDVLNIKRLLFEGKKVKDVAAQYNVTFQSIYQIGRGKDWTHVAPELGNPLEKRLFKRTPEQITEIRRLWGEEGMMMKDIAVKFDMWRPEVSKLLKGIPRGKGLPHWPGRPPKVHA